MEWCRIKAFLYYFSLETGVNIIVLTDVVLLLVVTLILFTEFDTMEPMFKSFEYKDIKLLLLLIANIITILSAITKLIAGIILYKNHKSIVWIQRYFYTSCVSYLLSSFSLILKLTVAETNRTNYIFFGIILGVLSTYSPHSLMVIYSYFTQIERELTRDNEKIEKLQQKAKRITENLGLSVIPEISMNHEISLHL